ncbi:potassium channel family protein [Sporolactobacillus kofuensis]
MDKKLKKITLIYHITIIFLALFSVLLVLCSLFHWLSIVTYPYNYIHNGGLIIFAIDYVIRFIYAHDKKHFLIENSFDLLGIIPMHPLFVFFRLGRVVRILRAHRIFVVLGIDGAFTGSIHKFIYSTGFIYLFSISVAILILSALLYSVVEKISLSNALWWAITTATTVGYGDIYPHTFIGKIIASILMIGGIGFIGLLTSTITDFFTFNKEAKENTVNQNELKELMSSIDQLSKKVDHLSDQVNRLTKQKKNTNHRNR